MFNKKAIGTLQVVTLIFASTAVAQQKAPAKQAAKQPIFDISSAPACASDSDVRSRIEWRQLSAAQQKEYTTAVQCLRKSGTGKNGEPTMSADFAKTHEVAAANNWAHGSPVFLPWHRIFVGLYEQALRSTCSYQAPLPYWDWSFDAGNLEKSQVISDFGGNGDRAKGFCVTSGPFADSNESSCIKRDLQGNFENQAEGAAKVRGEGGVSWSWIEMQNDIATSTNMAAVGRTLEFGAHAAIHNFVGGENGDMTRLARSARDALFYMHHTNVDRWYSEWQDANPTLAGQYNGKDLAGKAVSSTDTMFFNNMGSDVPVSKGLRTGKGTNGLTVSLRSCLQP
ncbi:hypothetical protein DFS34DRAFT_574600 [Phlyctochytrium arcticum]|nr:hypothetical protein DFS34DRAFT_574600 [Phlyctochytrium arcticum]